MPYRSAMGRFSRFSWSEVNREIDEAENQHLMEGIVAGCALVAYADGKVTSEEHDRMVSLIRSFEAIDTFGLDDVIVTFETMTRQFKTDHRQGEAIALKAVARLKGAQRYPEQLVTTCRAIAAADGDFDAAERRSIERICDALELDPNAFELVGTR